MMETRSAKSEDLNGRARDSILASIRNSLAASVPFDAEHQKHHQTDLANTIPVIRPNLSSAALTDNFRTNLEFVGGYCTIVSNETEALETVRSIIKKSGARRVAISDIPLTKS